MLNHQYAAAMRRNARLCYISVFCLAVMSLDLTIIMVICVHEVTVNDRRVPTSIHRVPIRPTPHVLLPSKYHHRDTRWRTGDVSGVSSRSGVGIDPHQFSYVLEPKSSCGERHLLVMYVHSDARNFDRRATIRRTWGNISLYGDNKVRLYFVVGLPRDHRHQPFLRAEARDHDDVIQLNFVEHYRNMTYKAIGALHWLVSRCRNATTFFLKTDDDTFVNTFALLRHVRALAYSGSYGSGLLICNRGHVKRVYRSGKWAVTRLEYPDDYFPHYCSGIGHLLTYDVARAISLASARVPYFWIDDVYVTGIIPELLHLKHIDMSEAYIRDVAKIDELFAGEEWYKFAFCHMPDLRHFENLWQVVQRNANKGTIPYVRDVVPGKLAENYSYRYRLHLPRYYVYPLL